MNEEIEPILIGDSADIDKDCVENFEYEENEQDKKRKIRLLDPSFIDQFVTEFKSLMKETII